MSAAGKGIIYTFTGHCHDRTVCGHIFPVSKVKVDYPDALKTIPGRPPRSPLPDVTSSEMVIPVEKSPCYRTDTGLAFHQHIQLTCELEQPSN